MKTIMIVTAVLLIVSLHPISALTQDNHKLNANFSNLAGPYLGQKPPGTTPELFADGIVANRYRSFHTSLMFSPEGNECYWQARLPDDKWGLVCSKMVDGIWTSPEIAPFSGTSFRDDAPYFSADGESLYFMSRRPIAPGAESGKENIWVVNRTDNGWGSPVPLPQIVNSMTGIHWQFCVAPNGDIYFSTYEMAGRGRRGNIYCSKMVNGEYSEPVKLGPSINTSDYEFAPFISPDGSYIIFSREKYGNGDCSLFISFRDNEGDWAEATNLYDSYGIKGICPIVSNDNRYLFFLNWVNSHSQPFWIDAMFIEELRPKGIE